MIPFRRFQVIRTSKRGAKHITWLITDYFF